MSQYHKATFIQNSLGKNSTRTYERHSCKLNDGVCQKITKFLNGPVNNQQQFNTKNCVIGYILD